MDQPLDRAKLGEWVKKKRKSMRLRQTDLVDDVISQTVISHIESGNGQVSQEKILYYLQKLKLNPAQLDQFTLIEPTEEKNLEEEWKLRLIVAENLIDFVGPDEGIAYLRRLSLPSPHPLEADVEYLKGKAKLAKKNVDKAYDHFLHAIHLSEQHSKRSNIMSCCYQELGRIEYVRNRFLQALQFSEKALSCYRSDGERTYVKDSILISKVIYLEKLNRIGEAQAVLDEFGQDRSPQSLFSQSKEALLNAHEMKARLLQKNNLFPQAVEMALKGIDLARIDKMVDRSFEVWVTLGSIYSEMDKGELAEICFRTALKLKHLIKRKYLLSYVYTQLGKLYSKNGELEKAIKEFEQALSNSQKHNEVFWQVEALMGLGNCYMIKKQFQEATTYFQQALALANEHRLEEKKTTLLLLQGQCLMNLGDPKLPQIALDLFYSQLNAFKGGEQSMPIKRHAAGDPPGT